MELGGPLRRGSATAAAATAAARASPLLQQQQQQQQQASTSTTTSTNSSSNSSGTATIADASGACAPLMPGAGAADVSAVGMESRVLFESCWRRFVQRHGDAMCVPRETVFLNGAPGSGKGVNTPHILETRGIDSAICVSSLLVRCR